MRHAKRHTPSSAAQVLTDESNLELEIYPDRGEKIEQEQTKHGRGSPTVESKTSRKRGYYLFEDLVDQHFNILEQIMEHQSRAAGQDGVNIKLRARKHLEGWDFSELATDHDPYPRVATLQAAGYGWVDFIRSIGAIPLLGRGFGELIRPVPYDGMCPRWESVPKHEYYLAASTYDLEKIMDKFGDPWADPPRLVHDLIWHCPAGMVARCQCQKHAGGSRFLGKFIRHHDPVQGFYPRKSRFIRPLKGPGDLHNAGAVVFGHSVSWGYRWREIGDDDLEEAGSSHSPQDAAHLDVPVPTFPSSQTSSQGATSPSFSGLSSKSYEGTSASTNPTELNLQESASLSQADAFTDPKATYETSDGSRRMESRNEQRARTRRRETRNATARSMAPSLHPAYPERNS